MLFEIHYNVFEKKLDVTAEGRPYSIHTLFAQSCGVAFEAWYQELPQWCYEEANGPFRVRFTGSAAHGHVLKAVFASDARCRSFQAEPDLITMEHRLCWIGRLQAAAGVSGKPVSVPVSVCAPVWQTGIENVMKLPVVFTRAAQENAKIILLKDEAAFDHLNAVPGFLAVAPGTGEAQMIRAGKGFLFRCPPGQVSRLVCEWVRDMLLAEYVTAQAKLLSAMPRWKDLDRKRIACLTGYAPYICLQADNRIERKSCGRFCVKTIPEDLPYVVEASRSGVLRLEKGGVIRPLADGSVEIRAHPKARSEPCARAAVTVYTFKAVADIDLKAPAAPVLPGETFEIRALFLPQDAHNKADAVWQVSPVYGVRMESPGRFRALKPGWCTITVTVGCVSRGMRLLIMDRPRDLVLDEDSLMIRMGSNGACVKAHVKPDNACWNGIRYLVHDSSVVSIRNDGWLEPRAEGETDVTLTLLDRSGKTVCSKVCRVRVIPEKDIITPEWTAVTLLILAACIAAGWQSDWVWLFLMAGMGVGAYHAVDVGKTQTHKRVAGLAAIAAAGVLMLVKAFG